jgi:putative ATP-dependent endonuclease of OLD family
VYLVPALARALGFDLDAHGVIVANVAGTDFAPYRIMLGPRALNVPHVVITDGDPVREDKHVYAGIARAVKLCPDGPAKDALANQVTDLIKTGAGADPAPARIGAMAADVFVGVQTLEIDIAALLADQMIKAHVELETSQNLIGSFDKAVRSVAQGGGDVDQRREVLRRVEHVSKGRFAQRLAAHVDGIGPAGLKAVIQGRLSARPEPPSNCAETMAGLMGAGSYGYLLAALDRVSWQVRGHGLLPGVRCGNRKF